MWTEWDIPRKEKHDGMYSCCVKEFSALYLVAGPGKFAHPDAELGGQV